MSRKKGLHLFEVGEMVFPHPVIYFVWGDCIIGETGIVTYLYKGSPNDPVRKAKVFWLIRQKEYIYECERLYHIQHDYLVEELHKKWDLTIRQLINDPIALANSFYSRFKDIKFGIDATLTQ